ncbi:hypothetical protein DPMN_040341 [Dreissena polymorpha]|uniref:Uncharacterized protein n=1 Tax=Dreissena polymorpha TaxID=45954 RepID=A0A9D4CWQ3_DREPO|nr:hypothetical protein DPMN_040341 [Dreissena polymorpha]
MAPDTKVPDGRTDGWTDGRTDNAKTISLRLWQGIINKRHQTTHHERRLYPKRGIVCSSSHCVNTFFVTVNNGGGGGGGGGNANLSSDNHLVDGPSDRQTNRHEQSNIPPLLRRGA